MITPTLLDVAAILGLPLAGKNVHAYNFLKKIDLGFVHAKGVYSTFIKQNAETEGEVTDFKHSTFLMYLFSKFFYGTASVGVVQELQSYVTMMIDNTVHSWDPFILVGLYKGIHVPLD